MPAPSQPTMRRFGDHTATRQAIFDGSLAAVQSLPPVQNSRYAIGFSDLGWSGSDTPSLADHKQALVEGRSLTRRLTGTVALTDRTSGQVVDTRRMTIAAVPTITNQGVFVHEGSPSILAHQLRLLPGPYTRRKGNGQVETHCFHPSTRVWTENGMIPIGELVRKRMDVRVWSYDFETETFVLRPVVGWFRNRVTTTMGRAQYDVRNRLDADLDRSAGRGTLWATPEHTVYDLDGSKRELGTAATVTVVAERMTSSQEQLLLGSLLGDGHVTENGTYQEGHCVGQRTYAELKRSILGPYSGEIADRYHSTNNRDNVYLSSYVFDFTRDLRRLCYRDGVKRVSREWLDRIDERGLAFWFCDDGSGHLAWNTRNAVTSCLVVTLATDGFCREDVATLRQWLLERWGLKTAVDRNASVYGDRDKGWQIKLTGEFARKLVDLIVPYIHPQFRYKLADRPPVGRCLGCGKEIAKKRDNCNACCLDGFVSCDTKNTARHRFGSVAEVKRIIASGVVPPEGDYGGDWDRWMVTLGTGLPAMVADSRVSYELRRVPVTYQTHQGFHFERTRIAYDIEVEGTHNYFANGVLVSNCNLLPGTGVPHRINLDPATGVFKTAVGQAEIPTISLLRLLGATPHELREAWGEELYARNSKADRPHHIDKYWEKMGPPGQVPDGTDKAAVLAERISKYPLDPWVSARTLGKPYDHYGKEPLLTATAKLLRVARGQEEPDDRDNPIYSTVWGPEHLIPERLSRSGPLLAKILWQATNTGSLKKIPPGFLSPAIRNLFTKSGLALMPEGSNAAEFMDHGSRITKVGEGGIGRSADSVPFSARNISAQQFPFIDAARSSESETIGLDLRVAFGTRLGSDRRLYAPVKDTKSGKLVFRSVQDMADKTLAFPGAMASKEAVVPVIRDGKITYAPKTEVDFVVPSMEQSFSPMTGLVPMKSAAKPHRSSMGSRMITQSLPLTDAEAPLVRTQVPGQPGKSYEEMFGRHMGAVFAADKPGQVTSVDPDSITVRYGDGSTVKHERYNYLPSGRKTSLHTEPLVKPGDVIQPGQILARSNYTDSSGHAAYGKNLRVAFMNMLGKAYEDAIVLSESAAKKMTSDHLYRHQVGADDDVLFGKAAHVAAFPGKHTIEKLKNFDDDGVVKVGTQVTNGDPLILAVRRKQGAFGRLSRSGKASLSDASENWEYDEPGEVVDVHRTKNGPVVLVKSTKQLKHGDKIAGRHGNKGVAVVMSDDQMPLDSQGRPIEMVISSLGIISRANPSSIYEALLGKIAEKTKQPYVVNDWDDEGSGKDVSKFVRGQLARHGLQAKEDLTDPQTGRKIPGVLTGSIYTMKLHHMSESKVKGRGLGGYDETGQPIRGQNGGAMRASLGDTNALLSHGATDNIFDAHAYRGQDSPEFWLAYMSGYPTSRPAVSKPFERFLTELRAAGIDPVKRDGRYHLMALTDKRVHELAGTREVKNGETLDFARNGEPVKGGLFDTGIWPSTDNANLWGKIVLHEPILNPAMEEPARRLLGLTEKQFRETIAGRHAIDGETGMAGLAKRLGTIDVQKELAKTRLQAQSSRKTAREAAFRRLFYLKGLERTGQSPKDWLLSAVPVLPPAFRPVSRGGPKNGIVVHDANIMYSELIGANHALRDLSKEVDDVGDERLNLYDAVKAVVGLGDPVGQKSREKGVKGVLGRLLGDTAKHGYVQQKLLGTPVNLSGRGQAVPNPDFDMDEIGIPESMAKDVYHPFVIRQLVRSGMGRVDAAREVENWGPRAKKALLDEMAHRPVLATRYPALHRYNVMAFRPRLVTGDALQINHMVVKGYNADFDGDAFTVNVPLSDDAVKEAYEKLMPSRNLYSPATYKPTVSIPGMEMLQGLHASSVADDGNVPVEYRTRADAIAAYLRGDHRMGTRVRILEDQ